MPTTSYAILGMLALRPWTAYELTQQLRRSLSYCWPKAESVLYDEPSDWCGSVWPPPTRSR